MNNDEIENRIVEFIKDADFSDLPQNTTVCFKRPLTSDEVGNLSLYLHDLTLASPDKKYNCLKLSKAQFDSLKELKKRFFNNHS